MNIRQEVVSIAERIALKNKREIDMRTLDFFSHVNEIVINDVEQILQEDKYNELSDHEREGLKFNAIFHAFMDILSSSSLNIMQWNFQFIEELHRDLSEYETVFDVTISECIEMFGASLQQKLQQNMDIEREMIASLRIP